MSGLELATAVIGGFFIAGIVAGVLLVALLPKWRCRDNRRYPDGGGWQYRPLPPEDGKPPRWPGR